MKKFIMLCIILGMILGMAALAIKLSRNTQIGAAISILEENLKLTSQLILVEGPIKLDPIVWKDYKYLDLPGLRREQTICPYGTAYYGYNMESVTYQVDTTNRTIRLYNMPSKPELFIVSAKIELCGSKVDMLSSGFTEEEYNYFLRDAESKLTTRARDHPEYLLEAEKRYNSIWFNINQILSSMNLNCIVEKSTIIQ